VGGRSVEITLWSAARSAARLIVVSDATDPNRDPRFDALVQRIADRLAGGSGPRPIIAELVEQGWTPEQAETLIIQVEQAREEQERQYLKATRKARFRVHMGVGALAFCVGLTLILALYFGRGGINLIIIVATIAAAADFAYGLVGYLN
jgi:hypothetical protein